LFSVLWPFREAASSGFSFGDRASYQMDPGNTDEALREVALDIEEGADIIMVKPAMSYLDIIYRLRKNSRCLQPHIMSAASIHDKSGSPKRLDR